MADLIQFPPSGGPPASVIGPARTGNAVVVDGRIIPALHCYDRGEKIELILDRRFSLTIPKEHAYETAWMIANALAVSQGYSYMGAETKDQPFAPIYREIDAPPTAT